MVKKGGFDFLILSNTVKTNNNNNNNNKVNKKVVDKVPNCDYVITSPNNRDKNVDIDPTIIRWKHSTGSPKGYYFSIATMIGEKMTYEKNKENIFNKKIKYWI